MGTLLLHPRTEAAINAVVDSTSHAVLLIGEKGAGKRSLAHEIAARLLGVSTVGNHAYFAEIAPEAKAVSIEQIRELNAFMKLKVPASSKVQRVVYVDQADSMTIEAQNALLKTLEEPPEGTVIILSAASPQNIAPTIHSRVQTVMLHPPTAEQATEYFKDYGPNEVTRAYSLSDGQVGLMNALLEQSADHEIAQNIELAKSLYAQTAYERLCQLESLVKQKDSLPTLVYACKRIAVAGMQQAASKDQRKVVASWGQRLRHVLSAEKALARNANPKLVLTDLFLNL